MPTRVWRAEPVSWMAFWASVLLNLLLWSGLVRLYQRATAGVAYEDVVRTPITWLPLPVQVARLDERKAVPSLARATMAHAVAEKHVDSLPSAAARQAVAHSSPLPAAVAEAGDDDWYRGGAQM